MKTSVLRLAVRAVSALLFAPAVLSIAAVPSSVSADAPADAVRVEIIEGLPDQTSWKFTNDLPAVTESYAEPAFGFVMAPTKYSPRGVKVDRGLPFHMRASGRVTLPKGEPRLLLRARTGARLWVDRKPCSPRVSRISTLTDLSKEAERAARAGDLPTDRLRAAWRERMEDAVWALVNSPEFVFVP